ncbi:MAG: TRAP transporter small permease [Rhodospirillaceae bacterium]|nr:TRAP transporter small permease [Rhodospirillaceae bacterium]
MLQRWMNHAEEGVIALLLAAMTLLTFTQVVLRYVFNSGLVWALEANTYMFAWMVLFGMSYGVRRGSHIGVDIVVKATSPPMQRLIGLGAAALAMAYAALLGWGGYGYVMRMHAIGVEAEDIPVERWILLLILPIGFALLFLRLLQLAWRILRGRQSGFTLADEAKETIEQLRPEAPTGGTQ